MTFRLALVGSVSILGQIVLLRELNVAFRGSELIYILGFGVWLVCTALGAAAGRGTVAAGDAGIRMLFLGGAAAVSGGLVLARGLHVVLGGVPGADLAFPAQVAGMTLVLLPASILNGLLFQWVARRSVERGRSLAGAYAVESVGALGGGALATLLLRLQVANIGGALACTILGVLAASLPWRGAGRAVRIAVLAPVALSLLIVGRLAPGIDARLTSWNHPDLLTTRDSPYGRVTLSTADGQIAVYRNGALAFDSESTAAEELAHLAAVQRPAPGSVLVLGGGVEGLVRELLRHRPARLVYVELNRVLLDLTTAYADPSIRASLEDPATVVVVGDPRNFLRREETWDLIVVGESDPDSAQTNRLYTRKFFELAASRLGASGVLALRLRGAENLWTPQQTRRAASIGRALEAAFADVVFLPGSTNVVVASRKPLSRDPALLGRRLAERDVRARLVSPAYVRYLYTNDRFHEIESRLAEADAPVNSDSRPVCYQYTLLIWLSRFFPSASLVRLPHPTVGELVTARGTWLVLTALVGVLLLARRSEILRRSLLAAVAGLAGMVLESLMILDYQTTRGLLFQDVGLLTTMFMGGLAAAAYLLDRWSRRNVGPIRPGRGHGAVGVAALASFSAGLAAWLAADTNRGLALDSLVLVACGALVGAMFSYAGLQGRPSQGACVRPLYASDLLGGAVGAVAAGLLLIPALGLPATALSMSVVALLACLLL